MVSFEKAPANIKFISDLFGHVAKAGINVDMISQTTPKSEHNTISFTVADEKVIDILEIIATIKKEYEGLIPLVSSGNVKICLYGEGMPSKVGVASDAFVRLNEKEIDIMLITTSDMDISIVVSSANADLAYDTLKSAYMP